MNRHAHTAAITHEVFSAVFKIWAERQHQARDQVGTRSSRVRFDRLHTALRKDRHDNKIEHADSSRFASKPANVMSSIGQKIFFNVSKAFISLPSQPELNPMWGKT
eukprot:gb/GECG01004602.1/.p1 GENE.gb/GECG01004602.1/~~gb/GECG01004602.1/.p1  ORF type:complete len:106 (+),score=4.43 gb/GECG01004602.1/:1-318(+)